MRAWIARRYALRPVAPVSERHCGASGRGAAGGGESENLNPAGLRRAEHVAAQAEWLPANGHQLAQHQEHHDVDGDRNLREAGRPHNRSCTPQRKDEAAETAIAAAWARRAGALAPATLAIRVVLWERRLHGAPAPGGAPRRRPACPPGYTRRDGDVP